MPSATIREQKQQKVQRIKENLDSSTLTLFADLRGLTVTESTSFRGDIRESGGTVNVFKNTLSRIALKELSIEYPEEYLVGPSAFISIKDDPVILAKTFVKWMNQIEKIGIKGGLLEKEAITEDTIKQLATLPGREELIAKAISLIKAPLTGLVATLSSPMHGMINVLNSIKEKKAGGD